MSAYPNAAFHAVLALLSEGYPPLEGRSPTRYSPVCHATNPLRGLRVRLACIRHAASVDSEPGSNSQVKLVRQQASLATRLATATRSTRSLLIWLSDSIPPRLRPPRWPNAATDRSSDAKFALLHGLTAVWAERSALILDGLCLHVLSSFQRTGFSSRAESI